MVLIGLTQGDDLFPSPRFPTLDLATNNTVLGLNGNDQISGGSADDSLYGNQGSDLLIGNAGNDALWGGLGVDTLNGGEGDDVLNGGFDRDMITGGAGSDLFAIGRYVGGPFKTTGGPNLSDADVFRDFNLSEDGLVFIGNLKPDDIQSSEGTLVYPDSTILQDKLTGEFLAILQGVSLQSFAAVSSLGNRIPVVTGELPAAKGLTGDTVYTSIGSVFADDEPGLTYSIENQSDLFSITSFDPQTGALSLKLTSVGFGGALVRATDRGGLFVQTTLPVIVGLPPTSDSASLGAPEPEPEPEPEPPVDNT